MGRAATGAFTAVAHLEEFTSRELFYRDGQLVSFPALDLLALRAGVNEKTMRRAIDKLEQAGLVRTQHRHNNSNLYYLTIPADAEAHLIETEAAIIKRAKSKKRRSQVSTTSAGQMGNGAARENIPQNGYQTHVEGRSQVSTSTGQMGAESPEIAPKCPTTSDSTSISKSRDEGSRRLENKKEEGVGEKEGAERKEENGEASPSLANPLPRNLPRQRTCLPSFLNSEKPCKAT